VPEPASPSGDQCRDAAERFFNLLREWRDLTSRLCGEAEAFTRERPGIGLGVSFVAGFLLGSLFGRRR